MVFKPTSSRLRNAGGRRWLLYVRHVLLMRGSEDRVAGVTAFAKRGPFAVVLAILTVSIGAHPLLGRVLAVGMAYTYVCDGWNTALSTEDVYALFLCLLRPGGP